MTPTPDNLLNLRKEAQRGLGGKSIQHRTDRASIARMYERLLLEDCLPFWFPACLDSTFGGFFSCLDQQGNPYESDKSLWAQGRMSWLLLRLHQVWKRDSRWFDWAESGLSFMSDHGFDQDGRMFFLLNKEGQALRKRRYAYSEAFAAIAYARYAQLTGQVDMAKKAEKLLRHFIHWNFDPDSQMEPKGTSTRPLIALGPYMIALVTAQELRAALEMSDTLNPIIDRMIEKILTCFVRPEEACVLEIATPEGHISPHIEGRTLNPGHAIEAAWFIMQEGAVRRQSEWIQAGAQMLQWMWDRAWDQDHGGLLYFTSLDGSPVQEYWHDMKFWWPHSETLIASTYAHLLTEDPRYADIHQKTHDWAFGHFQDVDHGEWFGYLRRDGTVSNPAKGNLWKSAFHHPRSLMLCCEILRGDMNQCSSLV